FSEEQIQKYIEGLVTTTPIIAFSRENAAERNVISGPISSGRPLDKVGGGYEVKSKAGYFKSTSYLTLPSFTSFYNYSVREQRTAGYMMFTLSSVNKTPIDIGISYSKGNSNSDTPRFYLFYYDPSNTSTNPNDAGGVAKFKEYPISTPISQGQNVYVKIEKIDSGEMNGYTKFTVMNATDFSQVYGHLYYYMGSRFPSSTGEINRQITLCDGSGQFTNGTHMNNAVFWQSWLYASSGYNSAPNGTNTVSTRRGAFSDEDGATDVTVNWYSPWNEESVNISF
ncbi:MAG: hypothetical protein Q4C14_08360, partial [Bacillota bacterium]|nr:hypothetical protein [Bacillota bacterium]